MNENEQWEQETYDRLWNNQQHDWVDLERIERIEHERYLLRARVWRALIIVWILASAGILAVTVLVKLYSAMVGQ